MGMSTSKIPMAEEEEKGKEKGKYDARTEHPPHLMKEGKKGCILPDDVMSDILLRMPARSIVKLRPACKLFYAITSDPSFIHLHAARAAPAHMLKFSNPYDEKDDRIYLVRTEDGVRVSTASLTIGYLGTTTRVSFEASCDGMLCFREFPSNRLFICNPLTRGDWIRLPNDSNGYHLDILGLYYHASTREYRLLCKLSGKYGVLTLGTNICRQIETTPLYPPFRGNACWLPMHDRLHWRDASWCGEKERLSIITFNTETEKFGQISIPGEHRLVKRLYGNNILMAIGDNLGLFQFCCKRKIHVYVLQDYASEDWTKLFSVSMDRIKASPPYYRYYRDDQLYSIRPIIALKNRGILFGWTLNNLFHCGMVFYDSKLHELKNIPIDGLLSLSQHSDLHGIQFVESPTKLIFN